MMRPTISKRTAIVGGVVVAAFVLLVFAFCRAPHNTLPDDIRTSVDSEKATRPAFDSSHTATSKAVTSVVTKIIRDEAAVSRMREAADREHARGDSLARLAQVRADSASLWHQAYDSRTTENGQLRIAVDTLTRDLTAAKDTLGRTKIQLGADSLRVADAVSRQTRMESTIEHSSPPCWTIPHVVGCSSRKVAFVSGAIVAGVSVYAWQHKAQVKSLVTGAVP